LNACKDEAVKVSSIFVAH